MKPSTAERFRGMRWLFLRNNVDTYGGRRGVSEVRARPIFDTMPDLEEETPESLLAETYRRIAAAVPAASHASPHESDSQFLQEVKERKKLKKWREGRSYREPILSSLPVTEKKLLNSQITDPQQHKESARLSAEKRLEGIFEPEIWAQLQELKKVSTSGEPAGISLLPKLKSRSTSHRAEKCLDPSELPSVVRRKQYGRWYLQPKDWNSKYQQALEESSRLKAKRDALFNDSTGFPLLYNV